MGDRQMNRMFLDIARECIAKAEKVDCTLEELRKGFILIVAELSMRMANAEKSVIDEIQLELFEERSMNPNEATII